MCFLLGTKGELTNYNIFNLKECQPQKLGPGLDKIERLKSGRMTFRKKLKVHKQNTTWQFILDEGKSERYSCFPDTQVIIDI